MKKTLAALGVFVLLALAVAIGGGTLASAHTQETSASCEGLAVNLTKYPRPAEGESATNDVYITMDGTTRGPIPFADAHHETFSWTAQVDSHTYSVRVDSADGIGEGPFDGTFTGDCTPPMFPYDSCFAPDGRSWASGDYTVFGNAFDAGVEGSVYISGSPCGPNAQPLQQQTLPSTGSSLTLWLAIGAGLILAAGVALMFVRGGTRKDTPTP